MISFESPGLYVEFNSTATVWTDGQSENMSNSHAFTIIKLELEKNPSHVCVELEDVIIVVPKGITAFNIQVSAFDKMTGDHYLGRFISREDFILILKLVYLGDECQDADFEKAEKIIEAWPNTMRPIP